MAYSTVEAETGLARGRASWLWPGDPVGEGAEDVRRAARPAAAARRERLPRAGELHLARRPRGAGRRAVPRHRHAHPLGRRRRRGDGRLLARTATPPTPSDGVRRRRLRRRRRPACRASPASPAPRSAPLPGLDEFGAAITGNQTTAATPAAADRTRRTARARGSRRLRRLRLDQHGHHDGDAGDHGVALGADRGLAARRAGHGRVGLGTDGHRQRRRVTGRARGQQPRGRARGRRQRLPGRPRRRRGGRPAVAGARAARRPGRRPSPRSASRCRCPGCTPYAAVTPVAGWCRASWSTSTPTRCAASSAPSRCRT